MGNEAIQKWMGDAPQEVALQCQALLDEVQRLRLDETIYPAQDDILNALKYTAPEKVRAVILGQDPYHGPHQAMGLSFSVPAGEKLPPSLRNIYKELVADVGCEAPSSGDLTSWAKQGVLLLNTTLTVREHAANSHSKLGWQVLTTYLVEQCFRLPQPIVFLAWGRHAVKLIEDTQANVSADDAAACANKFILKSTHPSPLSATKKGGELEPFIGSRPFSRANQLLSENGSEPIVWESVCR